MGMKLLEKVRATAELKDYGIAKNLNKLGIEVSISGVNSYNKEGAKSMRLDILCGLRKLSGLPWAEFGKWLDDEFLKKKP